MARRIRSGDRLQVISSRPYTVQVTLQRDLSAAMRWHALKHCGHAPQQDVTRSSPRCYLRATFKPGDPPPRPRRAPRG